MKPLTLSKIFPYLLNFPSTSSNLVTYLTIYKVDQATHQEGSLLSSPIFWNFTLLHISLNSSILFHFSYKISFLRKQHNLWHNTKNHSSSSYNLIYLLYLTFMSSISHFHIFYKHIPHKILIHTSHISLNSMSHKVYIYKIHVQQSIYI